MKTFLRDHGLSLVLLALFAVSIVGQSVAGLAHYNENQSEHRERPVSWLDYVSTPAFAESVFENWESEFLQMALYVALTAMLFQRGSAESKDPDKSDEVDEDPRAHSGDPDAPWPVRRGGGWLWLYQYSLSLVLGLLFAASFVLHLFSSHAQACREQIQHGRNCLTITEHLMGSALWFESFQNWQSEFLSICVVVVLSVFLRHRGSPESKPVHAPHSQTGR